MFIGTAGPLGTNGPAVAKAIRKALADVNHSVEQIRVIDQLENVQGQDGSTYLTRNYSNEEERYRELIKAGNDFCQLLSAGDALIPLIVKRIKAFRDAQGADVFVPRQVYLVQSLKRSAEADRLRSIYGPGFVLFAVHAPRDVRVQNLAKKIVQSKQQFDPTKEHSTANNLIDQDEKENQEYGQEVRAVFKLADFFVDGRTTQTIETSIQRFIDLLFSYQFHTPTVDEQGMMLASVAAHRSADLARQVGASILTSDGSVISVGCNDAPRPGGGQYWTGDNDDARDFQIGKDLSTQLRQTTLEDVVKRLADEGLLSEQFTAEVMSNPGDAVTSIVNRPGLREARILGALEYGRSVHAEMAAITDAARRGVSLEGSTLYTTTFPCHECTRHIVASGIRRVVYIEAYAKSLTPMLFSDSVEVDCPPAVRARRSTDTPQKVRYEQFVGVSPNLYFKMFAALERRGPAHSIAEWSRQTAVPRTPADHRLYLVEEEEAIMWLENELNSVGYVYREG